SASLRLGQRHCRAPQTLGQTLGQAIDGAINRELRVSANAGGEEGAVVDGQVFNLPVLAIGPGDAQFFITG
ncbi:MAG: hypothetical protein RL763_1434, partial [Pseudomonadota bacterium]